MTYHDLYTVEPENKCVLLPTGARQLNWTKNCLQTSLVERSLPKNSYTVFSKRKYISMMHCERLHTTCYVQVSNISNHHLDSLLTGLLMGFIPSWSYQRCISMVPVTSLVRLYWSLPSYPLGDGFH